LSGSALLYFPTIIAIGHSGSKLALKTRAVKPLSLNHNGMSAKI